MSNPKREGDQADDLDLEDYIDILNGDFDTE